LSPQNNKCLCNRRGFLVGAMAKIISLPVITKLDTDPDRVLQGAIGNVEGVVIAGYDKEGGYYFASSYADGAEVLWLLEKMKKELLSVGDE